MTHGPGISRPAIWILLGGVLLLWVDRLFFQPTPRGIDFEMLTADIREIFKDSEFESVPFEASELIPETHLHLMTTKGPSDLYALYVGQYPDLSGSPDRPHDPRLCYQNAGFDLIDGPRVVRVRERTGGGASYAIQRLVVAGFDMDGRPMEIASFYWSQFAGEMPGRKNSFPTAIEQSRVRLQDRRADLIWTRVEYAKGSQELTADLEIKFVALMKSSARAMGYRHKAVVRRSR